MLEYFASICLCFTAEQRDHCFQDIKTDFTSMGLNYQLYIKGNIYTSQTDISFLSSLVHPPAPWKCLNIYSQAPAQFRALGDAAYFLLTSLIVCKERQISAGRKPEAVGQELCRSAEGCPSFPCPRCGSLGSQAMQITSVVVACA